MNDRQYLIAHVIYRLDVGGLENGLVNLINRMPDDRFRHVIVCLAGYTDFRARIKKEVPIHDMAKQNGKNPALYFRLWRLFLRLKPDIVHTRNLATMEAQLPALLAGIPNRVHGEHGRDIHDLDNTSRKYRMLRMAYRPVIQRYIPLSRELEAYLKEDVRVPQDKIVTICNGVDTERFRPTVSSAERLRLFPEGFADSDTVVIGTVGRLEKVKDQLTLARAFSELVEVTPGARDRLRLVMVGEGALRVEVESILSKAGLKSSAWLPGSRSDIPELLRTFDIFVLPSLGEGISNTILEALASGTPVLGTPVGAIPDILGPLRREFIFDGTGSSAMKKKMEEVLESPEKYRWAPEACRAFVEGRYSWKGVADCFERVALTLLNAGGSERKPGRGE